MSDHPAVKSTDGPVSRYINRRLSWPLTLFIVKHNIPITPNQVSILSLVLSMIAGILVVREYLILGGILIQVSSILDGVDGELARVTGRVSRRGGFMDAVIDRYSDIAILLGLSIYIFTNYAYQETYLLILVLAALSGDLMVSYIHARGEATLGKHPALLGRVSQIASRDIRLFILFVGCLIQKPLEALIILALISHFYVIIKTLEVFFLKSD